MRTLLILLLAAGSVRAASVHPLLALLHGNPGLRLGVALELKTLSNAQAPLGTPASLEARKLATALVAYRAELPEGSVAAVLGEEAERIVQSFELASGIAAQLRESVAAHDPAAMEALGEKLDALFDNRAASDGGQAVVGKENAAPLALAPSSKKPGAFERVAFVALPEGEGMPGTSIEKGLVDGRPAVRVRLRDGSTLVAVEAGKASTWDAARALARDLGEGWDLPTEREYMRLTITAALDLKITMGKPGADGVYPMWVRADEDKNNAEFEGTSLVLGGADGKGDVLGSLDAGPKALADYRRQLAKVERLLAERRHRTPLEEHAIGEAFKKQSARTGAWYNRDVPHDWLPARIKKLIAKPSKARLEAARAALKNMIAAFESGYPVYAVSSPAPLPTSGIEAN